MQRNTTLDPPVALTQKMKADAALHGTTTTAIIHSHLEAVTGESAPSPQDDPLRAYSQGRLSRRDAIRLLDLRDYAELLVRLGAADLSMPRPAPHEIEDQALLFEKLWHQP